MARMLAESIRKAESLARGAAIALLCAAAAFGPAGCRRSAATASRGAPVVIISVDTLRADHLPAYGYRAVATPHLDALRRDAILFENAYSHVPLTLPSHAAIFTGLLPPQNGVRDNLGYALGRPVTLALPQGEGLCDRGRDLLDRARARDPASRVHSTTTTSSRTG
jgi:hypothetical protein